MKTVKTFSASIATLLALASFLPASFAQQAVAPVQPSLALESPQPADAPSGTSTIRIVRLSQVKGSVLLDRKTDRGFETAFANLPIAQGEALKTNIGVAEVEFEDNSSLRILPDTVIEFPSLERTSTGATLTTIKLLKGTLYVSLEKTEGNPFHILLGNDTITVTPSASIRLDAGTATGPSQLAIFKGSAQFTDASGTTTTVDKKKTLTFNASTQSPPVLLSKVESNPFDNWDKTSASYHNLRSVSSAYGNPGSTYGISDLNYYGAFANTACGSLWQPYFTGAGWDPFANGVWAWYPSVGYSWVSPYPWGWMPFHYGSWVNCGGSGWGWQPGGLWYGLQNQPTTLLPKQCPHCPLPPRAPRAGNPTFVAHNAHPIQPSRVDSEGNFVFRKGSAGIGVPREYFGKLNHFSASVEHHGTLSVPTIYSAGAARDINREGAPHGTARPAYAQGREDNASAYSAQSRSSFDASRGSSPGRSSESHGSSASSGWSGGGGGGYHGSAASSGGGYSGGGGLSASASSSASSGSSGGGGGGHR